MDFIKNSEIVFYLGDFIIILGVILFIYDEIKEDEGIYTEITLQEHKGFIIFAVVILVIGLWIWREIYMFIFDNIIFFKKNFFQTMDTIEKIING